MKKTKKLLSVLMVAAMFLSFVAASAPAYDVKAAESASLLSDEEAMSAASDVDAEIEEVTYFQVPDGAFAEGSYADAGDDVADPSEGVFSDVNEGTESLGGTVELTPEGNQIEIEGDDETLGFGEELGEFESTEELEEFENTEVQFDDGSDFELGESEGTVEDTEDLGLFGAKLSASRSSVVLNKGNSVTIDISYSNAPKGGKLRAGAWKNLLGTSDAVKLSWGKGSGSKVPLTISGVKNGTGYVEIFLCNKLGIPYAIAQIKVNVCTASLSCTSSLNQFSVPKGSSRTIYFRASGYSGASQICYSTTNTNAFSCSLSSDTMRITGLNQGSGTVRVYYKAKATGDVLATLAFTVTTTAPAVPKLTVSTPGVSVTAGYSRDVTVTYSGFEGAGRVSFSTSSSSVANCQWIGNWNGTSKTLRIHGNQNGAATITIGLYNSANALLATAKVSVIVAPRAEITSGNHSLSMITGTSGAVALHIRNVTSKHSISCTSDHSNIATGSLSMKDGNLMVTIAAKNVGSAVLTVAIRDAFGNIEATSQINVTVKPAPPSLTPSTGALSLSAGTQKNVTFTYANCSGRIHLNIESKSSNACNLQWGGWSKNSIPLTVKAIEPGTCSITVGLYSNDKLILKKTITVTVTPAENGKRLNINRISYGFDNYSAVVSLKNTQRIFGETERARRLYESQKDRNGKWAPHGVCFGMATSSSLLYTNTVSPSGFGASSTSGLKESSKSNYNSALGFTLSDFVEMMYMSQFSNSLSQPVGIDDAAKAIISEINQGRPVCLGFTSYSPGGGGHEVTAIGYSLSGNKLTVDIYDNNYHGAIRRLTMSRPSATSPFNEWSYQSTRYSSSGYRLDHSGCATINYTWRNRGNSSVIMSPMKNKALLYTSEEDFALYTMDFDTMESSTVAEYRDGLLVNAIDGVSEVHVYNNDSDNGSTTHYLYVPNDYYFVRDDTPEDGIMISIVDEFLSTTIQTDVSDNSLGAMGFCADDSERIAEASVSVADGANYQISIGSTSADGVSKTIVKEGVGTGNPVNLGLSADMLSLGTAEDSEGAVVTESFVENTYDVTAYAEEGGSITPAGTTLCKEGENLIYRISAEEGYVIDHVYVDDEDVGAVPVWYFEDIQDYHTITATFKRDISSCSIQLTQSKVAYDGSEQTPEIVVTAENGEVLEENVDYVVCYNNNVQLGTATAVVVAAASGGYYGAAEVSFEIVKPESLMIQDVAVNGTTVQVTLNESAYDAPSVVVGALYDQTGKMLSAKTIHLAEFGEDVHFDVNAEIPDGAVFKVFLMTEGSCKPRTAAWLLTMD